ncbi:ERG3, C-5 sterol desaturase [Dissoconium aciculare CBS 342.82]|uniref:ERG3, C-5 sterol desaturase n=1 Tax=Dissoconium aciculare CBS 342.82 TaxID=1314786 RepID=A0A6J3M3P3_9PEZI|nr:ERG3, C-5 sterol desaturase [Dissoconium aciculare CBS 342.82]KAF1822625.1 ERG3, C-5 sterol desaturase [Dissoconium aciculare CBS 342.82]
MDVVLEFADTYVFDRIYANLLPLHTSSASFDPISTITASFKNETLPIRSTWQWEPASQFMSAEPSEYAYLSQWDRDNVLRQSITLFFVTMVSANLLYFVFATLSYLLVFDHATFKHPKYLKNQMRLEITQAVTSIPAITLLTVPFFVAEVRGHSYMYDTLADVGYESSVLSYFGNWYTYLQFPLFLMFTDFGIYWIHRGLHHPIIYRHLHKPHHKWIMPTPYASIAFHPLDGYAQSVPYHVFPFLMPLNKFAYLALFTFIQIWTVMIHDGEYVADSPIINGAACHTMHHLYFNYNYGQFTTLWDRLGGSYRRPNPELFRKEQKMSPAEWQRQTQEMERMVVEVEGADDRSYAPEEAKKTQ